MVRFSTDAVVCKHARDVIGPQYYETRKPLLDRALAGEMIITDTVIRRPDGEDRTAEVRYIPRRTAEGRWDGIYILIIDINSRKQTEVALKRSNDASRLP